MKSRCFLAALLMVLVGCNRSPNPSTSETPASSPTPVASAPVEVSPAASPTASEPAVVSSTASPTTSKQLSPPASAAFTISPDGIGPARVGMTVGELKNKLKGEAEFQVKSPFIVDFDAIAVSQSGKEQFYILYPAGSPLADTDVIEALVTNNPNYRTPQGVGPGTPLQQAEAAYGDATLSYNLANESREYVKFPKQPAKNLSFRLGAANDGSLAGTYPSQKGEFNQTKEYKKTASIGFVEVYCGQNCPLPSP